MQGYQLKEAAEKFGLSKSTVYAWKTLDPEFQELLAQAEDAAVEAFLEEGVQQVRNQIMDLGPRAAQVLRDSLEHSDPKVRLQAAGMVLRHGGGPAESLNVMGFERALAATNDDPASGD